MGACIRVVCVQKRNGTILAPKHHGHHVQFLQRQIVFDVFSRHSVVFSNVPGPKAPVVCAGKQIEGLQMVYPNLLPQVGILSYKGMCHANIVLDDEVVKSPEILRKCFVTELQDLAIALGVDMPSAVLARLDAMENKGL